MRRSPPGSVHLAGLYVVLVAARVHLGWDLGMLGTVIIATLSARHRYPREAAENELAVRVAERCKVW